MGAGETTAQRVSGVVCMKLTVSKKNVAEDSGIVYLLEIHMEDKVLVKIGVSSRTDIAVRTGEILASFFQKYRYFPYCRPKRFKKTDEIYKKEAMLHKYFDDRRYKTEYVFGGCTEMFNIGLDEAVEVYERVLAGEDVNEGR